MPIKTAVDAMNFRLESKEFSFLLFLLLFSLFPNNSFLTRMQSEIHPNRRQRRFQVWYTPVLKTFVKNFQSAKKAQVHGAFIFHYSLKPKISGIDLHTRTPFFKL